jgi:hypothetical protein
LLGILFVDVVVVIYEMKNCMKKEISLSILFIPYALIDFS